MNILYINIKSAGIREGYPGLFVPLGMACISAMLKKHGYQGDCIDLQTEAILKDGIFNPVAAVSELKLEKYDVVAFGGTFLTFKDLQMLSQKIWEVKKDIFQIAGGQAATAAADVILRKTRVGCVCLYEGEKTVVELLDLWKDGGDWSAVRGIKYLNEAGEVIQTPTREKISELDELPYPAREDWNFKIIKKAFPYGSPARYCAVMFASRGCPFTCIFCHPTSGKVIRTRSPQSIVSEIKYLQERYNVQYIRFFDEVFIGPKRKIKELCDLIIQEKLNIFWWCQTQVKLVDEELLRIMRHAGCIEVAYGIESGSNVILSEMKKGITKELSKEVIEMTNRSGIRVSISMIAGTPSETLDTLRETRDFVMSLNHINWVQQVPSIGLIIPLPGTSLYEIAKEKNFIKDEEGYLTESLCGLSRFDKSINLTQLSDEEFFGFVEKCNAEIQRDYYAKHRWKKVLSILGLDHLRWDLMFRHFSLSQVRPILEALLWATLAKRNNKLGRFLARLLYSR